MSQAAQIPPSATEPARQLAKQEQLARLQEHTIAFGTAVIQALEDFFGVQAEQNSSVVVQKGYAASGDVHFSIPFTGLVNGEYVISLDEQVAANIIDCDYPEDGEPDEIDEFREEIGAAICEALNTAVGGVIGQLAERYPHLSFASPRISYGKRVFPLLRFAYVDLESQAGSLRCHFYVDHMELDLATSYQKVRGCMEKTRSALEAHVRKVEQILEAINTAVFWVRPDGSIANRHSLACAPLLGVEPSKLKVATVQDLVASHLGGQPQTPGDLIEWIQQAFASQNIEDWESESYPGCLIHRTQVSDGRSLQWRWLPVRRENQHSLSAILVAVDDMKWISASLQAASSELVKELANSELSVLKKLAE